MKKFIITEDLVKAIRETLGSWIKHANKCSYVDDDIGEEIEKILHDFNTGLQLCQNIEIETSCDKCDKKIIATLNCIEGKPVCEACWYGD